MDFDKERQLCEKNIAECDKSIAALKKRRAEWVTRLTAVDDKEKLEIVKKSKLTNNELAEILGVKNDDGNQTSPKNVTVESSTPKNGGITESEKESA